MVVQHGHGRERYIRTAAADTQPAAGHPIQPEATTQLQNAKKVTSAISAMPARDVRIEPQFEHRADRIDDIGRQQPPGSR